MDRQVRLGALRSGLPLRRQRRSRTSSVQTPRGRRSEVLLGGPTSTVARGSAAYDHALESWVFHELSVFLERVNSCSDMFWRYMGNADGTRNGYELHLMRAISEAVRIPVIASGGAGVPDHLYDVLTEGKADAALVASMVHSGDNSVSGLKRHLDARGSAA